MVGYWNSGVSQTFNFAAHDKLYLSRVAVHEQMGKGKTLLHRLNSFFKVDDVKDLKFFRTVCTWLADTVNFAAF